MAADGLIIESPLALKFSQHFLSLLSEVLFCFLLSVTEKGVKIFNYDYGFVYLSFKF